MHRSAGNVPLDLLMLLLFALLSENVTLFDVIPVDAGRTTFDLRMAKRTLRCEPGVDFGVVLASSVSTENVVLVIFDIQSRRELYA